MIITLTKKQKAFEAIKYFEKEYGSLKKLKQSYEFTGNYKLLVDSENWEYLLENPEEELFQSKSIVTNKLTLTDFEMEILDFISSS